MGRYTHLGYTGRHMEGYPPRVHREAYRGYIPTQGGITGRFTEVYTHPGKAKGEVYLRVGNLLLRWTSGWETSS